MKAIAWVESRGRPDAVGILLRDGNKAIGIVQINTVHLPALKKEGITLPDLFDSCKNLKIGGHILAECMRKFGNTWKAVGCYNTGPASKNIDAQERYVEKVRKAYLGYRNMANR